MKNPSVEIAILALLQENNYYLKAHGVFEHLHPGFLAVNPSTV